MSFAAWPGLVPGRSGRLGRTAVIGSHSTAPGTVWPGRIEVSAGHDVNSSAEGPASGSRPGAKLSARIPAPFGGQERPKRVGQRAGQVRRGGDLFPDDGRGRAKTGRDAP